MLSSENEMSQTSLSVNDILLMKTIPSQFSQNIINRTKIAKDNLNMIEIQRGD